MTAYSITPVDAQDRLAGQLVESCTVAELFVRCAELSDQLERVRTHAENESQRTVVALRRAAEARAVMRMLAGQSPLMRQTVTAAIRKVREASIERAGPNTRAAVAAAVRAVYGRLP